MSAENRLHFFRMCAWGMFDPDQLPPKERKVRIRQIRHVIEEDLGFRLHVSGSAKKTGYVLLRGDRTIWWWDDPRLRLNTLPNICAVLLRAVDAKFPPNPTPRSNLNHERIQ